VESLNERTAAMAEQFCPDRYMMNSILYIPIQWRRAMDVRPLRLSAPF